MARTGRVTFARGVALPLAARTRSGTVTLAAAGTEALAPAAGRAVGRTAAGTMAPAGTRTVAPAGTRTVTRTVRRRRVAVPAATAVALGNPGHRYPACDHRCKQHQARRQRKLR